MLHFALTVLTAAAQVGLGLGTPWVRAQRTGWWQLFTPSSRAVPPSQLSLLASWSFKALVPWVTSLPERKAIRVGWWGEESHSPCHGEEEGHRGHSPWPVGNGVQTEALPG